jgi:phosphatidylserine synthase
LIALIIAHFKLFGDMPVQRNMLVCSLMLLLGLLMVSTVPYWSFKDLRFSGRLAMTLFAVAAVIWLIGMFYPVSTSLVILLGTYIVAGLTRWVWMRLKAA